MGIACRPLSEADFPLVSDLARRIWPVAYAGILSEAQLENLLTRIYCADNLRAELAAGHRFWAACDGGEVLGFASGYREDETVWVKKLYVLSEAQGRGAGKALLQTIEAAFAPVSAVRLYVNAENISAQAFYRRCGFMLERQVPVQMGDYTFTDFIFVKRPA